MPAAAKTQPDVQSQLRAAIQNSVGIYMLSQIGGIDRDGNLTPKGRIFSVPYIKNVMVPALHMIANHEIDALLFLLPRRHIKTFLATKNFLAWCFGRYPDRTNMALSYSDDFAHQFGRDILMRVSSPIHQAAFPGSRLMPKYQGQGFFQMTAGGQFFSAGFGGRVVGIGVSGVLCTDDPIRGMEQAESEAEMRGLMETRRSTVFPIMEGASEVCAATRWCRTDYVGRLLDAEGETHEGGRWTVITLPAEAGEDDPLGREPGEFLWPQRHPEKWYLANKKNTKTWMALFQQDPQRKKGLIFKREWLQYYTTRPKPGKWPTYMVCDPAKGRETDKDRTCMLVFQATQEKRLVLVDASLGRYDPDERAREVVRLCKKWKPVRFLYEEYGMNNDSWYLNKEMAKAKIRIHPITVGRKGRANQSKETRIEGLIPDFREGQFWFPAVQIGDEVVPRMNVTVNLAGEDQEPEYVDFMDYFIEHEYAVYAGEDSIEHDDVLDAMSRVKDPELHISYPLAPMAQASAIDARRQIRVGGWESAY